MLNVKCRELNLLPKNQQESIENEIKFRFTFVIFSMVIFWLLIFLVLELAMILYLKVQIPTIESIIERENETDASKATIFAETEIRSLNDTLDKVDMIYKGGIYNLPGLMVRIGDIMPAGAHLERISVSPNSIALSGTADRRSDVLELKEMLEKEDFCHTLDAPIAPLREEDVQFNFNCSN